MILNIAGNPDEKVKTFHLHRYDNGTVCIRDEVGWSIVTFGIVDGKLVMARNAGIEDSDYNTDDNGRIQEVAEKYLG